MITWLLENGQILKLGKILHLFKMNCSKISKAYRKLFSKERGKEGEKKKTYLYLKKNRTFEVYVSELETGMLQWSPSHLSENFWKQNAARLNENNQKLLR